MNSVVASVTSQDGTNIAFDKQGEGPAVIAVDGALCTRSVGSKPELVKLLAEHFTVYSYDRRGRGESGDTKPYAVTREVEDIDALIDDAGGTAYLYGHSSGAALAFEAAISLGPKVKRLAMYEAPYNDAAEAQQAWKAYSERLAELVAAGRRGDAAALFMKLVGMPQNQLDAMRQSPDWSYFEAVAPSLAYDAAVMGEYAAVPAIRAASLRVPTLLMNGSASFPFMDDTARALCNAMPDAQHRTLVDQRHDVAPEVLAPVLREFFGT